VVDVFLAGHPFGAHETERLIDGLCGFAGVLQLS
jgi:hypothetical protein